jgi:hypothetical protein
MKLKTFRDNFGDRMTVGTDGGCVEVWAFDDTQGKAVELLFSADTAEAVGRRLLKAARKLRKAEANGEE